MSDEKTVLRTAIDRYGVYAQCLMLFEEMAELQKEVCKNFRGADNTEQIAEEITALEDAIKAEMMAQHVNEMQVDVYKVKWMTVKSSRFDTGAFRKAMPELAEQFTRQTETRRFCIA